MDYRSDAYALVLVIFYFFSISSILNVTTNKEGIPLSLSMAPYTFHSSYKRETFSFFFPLTNDATISRTRRIDERLWPAVMEANKRFRRSQKQ